MTTYLAPSASMPTIWRYTLRGPHHTWAVIVIDSHGFVFVNSDFGGYAHRWTHFGPCIRTFLAECEGDYVLGKLTLGWPLEYDAEKTLRAVKDLILRERRSMGLTKREARAEWDLLEDYEDLDSKTAFRRWLDETDLHKAQNPLYELADHEPNRDAQRFVETLWPILKATLRDELTAESSAAASTGGVMACRTIMSGPGVIAIACGRARERKRCATEGCTGAVVALCDFPLKGRAAGRTCDRAMCAQCRNAQTAEIDFCAVHDASQRGA